MVRIKARDDHLAWQREEGGRGEEEEGEDRSLMSYITERMHDATNATNYARGTAGYSTGVRAIFTPLSTNQKTLIADDGARYIQSGI